MSIFSTPSEAYLHGLAAGQELISAELRRLQSRVAELEAQLAGQGEPVAVVGDVFTLLWLGTGPIAPLINKHGIKVGDKLFTRPAKPLTDEQILYSEQYDVCAAESNGIPGHVGFMRGVRYAERAHGITKGAAS